LVAGIELVLLPVANEPVLAMLTCRVASHFRKFIPFFRKFFPPVQTFQITLYLLTSSLSAFTAPLTASSALIVNTKTLFS